jgi:hypothetical protein
MCPQRHNTWFDPPCAATLAGWLLLSHYCTNKCIMLHGQQSTENSAGNSPPALAAACSILNRFQASFYGYSSPFNSAPYLYWYILPFGPALCFAFHKIVNASYFPMLAVCCISFEFLIAHFHFYYEACKQYA